MSLAEEVGVTIRVAIAEWQKTLRLMSLFVAMTGPLALVVLLVTLQCGCHADWPLAPL